MKKILIFSLIFILSIIIFAQFYDFEAITQTSKNNLFLQDNKINFSSLSLKDKLAQMIIVRGDFEQYSFVKFNVGGIFLDSQNSSEEYSRIINIFQNKSKIKLFISTDLEGAWTPFKNPKPNEDFPTFSEIKSIEEAFSIGIAQGKLLKEIGFNLNFAPVSEFSDEAYGGRVFRGNEVEIKIKIENYILGLQKNVFGTCKHYPGNALKKNLHDVSDFQIIQKKDLTLFNRCIEKNITGIMIGHQIVGGELNSEGKPSSVSKEIISTLDNYSGLIISDEINMAGLNLFYKNRTKLYVDLINAGENLILDFDLAPKDLNELLSALEEKTINKEIDENKINESVLKILKTKGYEVLF